MRHTPEDCKVVVASKTSTVIISKLSSGLLGSTTESTSLLVTNGAMLEAMSVLCHFRLYKN